MKTLIRYYGGFMMQILRVVFAIIAAFIGAGFASGQEINVFFYSYGIKGLAGLAICSSLMAYLVYKVLKIVDNNYINNYKDFVYFIAGKKENKRYFNIAYIINIVVNLFLIISFFIMIAGFGAYFSQELAINSYIGSSILAVVCFITFLGNGNRIMKVNSILIPILIFFIIIIGITNIITVDVESIITKISKFNGDGWLLSSILYSSYNSIFLVPVIITLRKFIKQKSDLIIIALIIAIIIFVLAIAIYLLLVRINIDIKQLEMPVIYVISNYFYNFRVIYSFIILTSIYTTATSIGIGVLENIANSKKSYIIIEIMICLIGFLVSGIGFSNLIIYIYPIFGYLGLFQIVAVFMKRKE